MKISSTWLQTRFLSFLCLPWSSHSCNDRRYSYFTRNICNFALTALKSSLKHRRKHVLRLLRLYGDQALKPGLYIVGRIVSMCFRPCPKEHITAPQVLIANICCERLLLSKTCVTMRKNCLLITPIIRTESLVHG